MFHFYSVFCYLTLLLLTSCQEFSIKSFDKGMIAEGSERLVVKMPEASPGSLRKYFTKFMTVASPNGGNIYILGTDSVPSHKVFRTASILKSVLTNDTDLEYGYKNFVMDAMAERRASVYIFENEDQINKAKEDLEKFPTVGVSIDASKIITEGSPEYFSVSRQSSDITFQKCLELIYEYGIIPALPPYQYLCHTNASKIIKEDLFVLRDSDFPEKDYGKFYYTYLFDAYISNAYGIYDYRFVTREEMKVLDPRGYAMISSFFSPFLGYDVVLPPTFSGKFYTTRNITSSEYRYTLQSRFYKNVTLTGNVPSSVYGNEFDNVLTGNDASNILCGGAGDDMIFGGGGVDTALYKYYEFAFGYRRLDDGSIEVKVTDPQQRTNEGTDILKGVEFIQFRGLDEVIEVKNIK